MEQNKRLRTKIGKLLSSSKEGFAEVVEYEPKDFLEKQHGNVYFLVEVTSGSKNAISIGEAVINAIRDEFYEDLNRSVVLSLEYALRKANEELSDLTSAGETDWIGKLNVICAVISEGKLHLSKVGATEAYILRGSKITHISEDGPSIEENSDKHPMKTFSTITSGKLEAHDKILFSTADLFSHITVSGVKKIVEENSPSGTISKLKDLLKDEEGMGAIGTLIIEMVTEDEISKDTGNEIDEIWIDDKEGAHGAKAITAGIFASIGAFFSKGIAAIKTKTVPHFQQKGKEAMAAIKGQKLDPIDNNAGTKSEPMAKDTDDQDKLHLSEKSKTKDNKDKSFIDFTKNYFKNFSFNKFTNDTKKAFSSIKKYLANKFKNKSFKFLVGGVILLLFISFFTINNYKNSKNQEAAKKKYDQAVELYNKAESALIYEARTEAHDYLDQSKSLVEDVIKSKFYVKESDDLASKISSALKKADGLYEVSANTVVNLAEENPKTITMLDKNIYVTTEKKTVVVYNVETNKKDTINVDTENNLQNIVAQPTTNKVIVYTDNAELFEIDIKTLDITKMTALGDGFKKASAVAVYNANIYLLSTEDNQIYRYTKLATKYSSPSKYINDNSVTVKNAVSISIPGAVESVDKDANLTKMVKGKRQEFSLSGSSVTPQKITKMQNNEKDDNIYLLDSDLGVIIYKLNGVYQKVLTPKDKQTFKDFVSDPSSGIIYLINGSKVVSFGK